MSEARDLTHEIPPLITVAMPVYNAGHYLRLAVLSIVKQTFADWELLIVDDGSTDDALQSIADIDDARIRIYRDGANKGLAARLNECIDLANGQYIARMDQDDVSFPERFDRQVKAFQQDTELDLVAVRAITISGDNQFTGCLPFPLSRQELYAKPWRGFYLPHPTWMGKTTWFKKYRYMIPGPYFCEDQELLLRSYNNSRFELLSEILFAYRVRDGINWNKQIKTRLAVFRVQWRHFVQMRQWHFAALAMTTLFSRLGRDLLQFIAGIKFSPNCRDTEQLVRKWKDVLALMRPFWQRK